MKRKMSLCLPLCRNKIKVSNVGDVEYMENYDNRDADSIFRSPIGSINGDVSVDEEKEERKSYK